MAARRRLAADRQLSARGRRRHQPRFVPSWCLAPTARSAWTSRPAGAEEEAMAVITIQGLTKRFGPVVAVDALSSEFDQGTVSASWAPTGPARPPPYAPCSAW